MSVVVHPDMPIELALRLFWREANREGVFKFREERRYYVPKSVKVHEKKRVYEKMKRRRRAAARRNK
ncbi:30S ribosomal protein S21 [Candidatus Dojkabacteria bacterium]|uniref:30S ribosomal protein S21 n=1 Tax=Candidatus Dojkabacteria bacterium TaxID=2099670 RepID=A0A3M0Z1I9_9BACT|nr:MAG: 30S ribosomal protein S21 [Candidatus Dojkabacteria bacterium]